MAAKRRHRTAVPPPTWGGTCRCLSVECVCPVPSRVAFSRRISPSHYSYLQLNQSFATGLDPFARFTAACCCFPFHPFLPNISTPALSLSSSFPYRNRIVNTVVATPIDNSVTLDARPIQLSSTSQAKPPCVKGKPRPRYPGQAPKPRRLAHRTTALSIPESQWPPVPAAPPLAGTCSSVWRRT